MLCRKSLFTWSDGRLVVDCNHICSVSAVNLLAQHESRLCQISDDNKWNKSLWDLTFCHQKFIANSVENLCADFAIRIVVTNNLQMLERLFKMLVFCADCIHFLEIIWKFAERCSKYIEDTEMPWLNKRSNHYCRSLIVN